MSRHTPDPQPDTEALAILRTTSTPQTLEFTGIPRLLEAAVERFGHAPGEPDVDELVELDREIRARFAHGPVGGPA